MFTSSNKLKNLEKMKTFKHTTGVWKNTLCGIVDSNDRLVAQCNYATTFFNGKRDIQWISSHEEYCGNGNLIAAAPEILDALSDCVKLLRIYARQSEPSLNETGVDANIYNRANELVKRLTGIDLINEARYDANECANTCPNEGGLGF